MTNLSGRDWLRTHFPNLRHMDMTWTAARYNIPPFVLEFIKQHWIKESDDNGGTYVHPNHHMHYTYHVCG